MTVTITVVGGGLAGAALAWRLAGTTGVECTLVPGARPDATAVSGGVVRAYDRDELQRELALESLLELQADARLQDWSSYRSGAFTYLLEHDPQDDDELALAVKEIDRVRPGSIELTSAPDWVAGRRWALVEPGAGRIDPDRLRHHLLADAAARIHIGRGPISEVGPGWVRGPDGRHDTDVVVLATGAATPALLREPAPDQARTWCTRVIRYAVYATARGPRPNGFVDERTGLYGTPLDDGLLLGLPTDEWDAEPAAVADPATAHHDRAAARAVELLPGVELGPRRRTAAAADCYPAGTQAPVLDLRPVPGTGGRLTTFTGGSGGAAKTVLSASARAATRLASL